MPKNNAVLKDTGIPYKKVGNVPVVDLHVVSLQMKVFTTRPTTGLTRGDLVLLVHTSTPKLGVCISTAAQTIKMVSLKTKTFGRLTA